MHHLRGWLAALRGLGLAPRSMAIALAAWRGLGLGHQRMGQNPEARSAFERYLRMAPNARDADMIRARLESL